MRLLPKNKKVLGIPQENWPGFQFPVRRGPKMIGLSEDGKFLLRKVDHPGVVAKPYMTPAIIAGLARSKTKDQTRCAGIPAIWWQSRGS